VFRNKNIQFAKQDEASSINESGNAVSSNKPRGAAKSRSYFQSQVWDWMKIILIILFIKGCVVDQYTIPSGSMEPTLQGDPRFMRGDRVLVNKWILGPRIPFTNIRLFNWKAPERWDIVVFNTVEGSSEHKTLVKRVVGLPGERIQLINGRPVVNGTMLELPEDIRDVVYYYNDEDILRESHAASNMENRMFFMRLRQQYPYKYGVLDDSAYLDIPEGHYLMLGDNSLNSVDGRHYGWVPKDKMLGPVFAIWWPLSHRRDFSGFTQTWWGQGLLYGLPALLIGWECLAYLQERKRKRKAVQDSMGEGIGKNP